MPQPLARAVLAALALHSFAQASLESEAAEVLKFGPRVTGSAANEQARTYLEGQFRALGYETRREAFTYEKFLDLGSTVSAGSQVVGGAALNGSVGGQVTAAVVRVPGVGTPEDFAGVDVRGKVAVVARGQLTFLLKARNALNAGAAGLIIVNNAPGNFRGSLGETVRLPVLSLAPEAAGALRDGQTVTLSVRVQQGEVQAFNLVAFKSGVTKPQVLFGAHMDSVQDAPGANDNLSGTLGVLELARRSVNTPLGARAYFVLFDGEEDGLLGSKAFVKENADLSAGLKAMFNMDMIGVNVEPLSVSGDGALLGLARRVAGMQVLSAQRGGSDHVPFQQAGVPALFFHRGLDANYHQPGDTILDPALIRETVDIALKIADQVLAAQPAG